VFGDAALARDIRALEAQYLDRPGEELLSDIAAAIRGRYDLTDDAAAAGVFP